MDIIKQLAQELSLKESQVRHTVELLDEGNTIPFIARYRKEATGELDEVQIRGLADRLEYLRNLAKRKEEVTRLIAEQEKLTAELEAAINAAVTLQEIEDLYQPFRPKRRTRASMAKEKGLEPLAEMLLKQGQEDPVILAEQFVNEEVTSPSEALQGAQDIIAEHITDQPEIRQMVRKFTYDYGSINSSLNVDPETDSNAREFQMYFEYTEEVRKIPPHRILAINRGERLGVLKVKLSVDEERVLQLVSKKLITNPSSPSAPLSKQRGLTATNAYLPRRAGYPQLSHGKAEAHAIEIFATNLRSLLMQAPVRGYRVLGIDPAYRTGCKVVQWKYGVLLEYTTPSS